MVSVQGYLGVSLALWLRHPTLAQAVLKVHETLVNLEVSGVHRETSKINMVNPKPLTTDLN